MNDEIDVLEKCSTCGLFRWTPVGDKFGNEVTEHECSGIRRFGLSNYPGEYRMVLAPHDGGYVLLSDYLKLNEQLALEKG